MATIVVMVAVMMLLPSCTALYEEHAGAIDWTLTNVGAVRSAIFHPNTQKRSVFVATDAATIASLKLQNGKLAWKQTLPEQESIDIFAFDQKKSLLTISDAGAVARVWSANDGTLQWESGSSRVDKATAMISQDLRAASAAPAAPQSQVDALKQPVRPYDGLFVELEDDESGVAVLFKNIVTVYDSRGGVVWTWSGANVIRLFTKGKTVYAIASTADNIVVTSLGAATGTVKDSRTITSKVAVYRSTISLLSSGVLALLDRDTSSITLIELTIKSAEPSKIAIKSLLTDAAHIKELAASSVKLSFGCAGAADNLVVIKSGALQFVIDITSRTSPKLVQAFGVTADASYSLAGSVTSEKKAVISRTVSTLTTISSDIIDIESSKSESLVSKLAVSDRGYVVKTWLNSFKRADNTLGYRILSTSSDASVSLIQKGEIVWTRDEALASVTQVEFVDLPVEQPLSGSSNGYPNLLQRIPTQIQQFVSGITSILKNPAALIAKAPRGASSSGALVQDHFGFRKIIVTATAQGKLYGINSETGDIVWSRYISAPVTPPSCTSLATPVTSVERPWRLYRQHHDIVSLITRSVGTDGNVTHSTIYQLQAITGAIATKATKKIDADLIHVSLLPLQTGDRVDLLMAVDSRLNVIVLPDTKEARNLFSEHITKIFFHQASVDGQSVTGYAITGVDGGKFRATNIWTVAFPAGVEYISSISSHASHEVAQSALRVVGGEGNTQSYPKYLNPNLLVVGTVRGSPPVGVKIVPSVKRTSDPSINVYLIDAVSGGVLNKLVHRGGEGPVNIVQSENVIVYHYFDTVSNQYEVSVLELYEDSDADTTGVFDGPTFSSLTAPPPQVLQQTYTFRTGIRTLAVSSTRRGLSPKDFLFGLTNNQILSVPKHFVDPRRPVLEADTPRPEGIIPYMKELPADPLAIISYNQTISNLRGIATTATLLESTSVVVAYGVDIFCTRLTPSSSQPFDLLNEDFNYPMLIATVSLVAALIVVTHRMAESKKLKLEWK